MKVFVAQLYIEPGVYFPYSHRMQAWLSNQLTALAKPGPAFLKSYGKLFELMIRLGAKPDIRETEIVGPAVFKKDKDVEYSLFLPFDPIRAAGAAGRQLAAEKLLDGVAEVFERAGVEAPNLSKRREALIKKLATDDKILKEPWDLGSLAS